jgi:hypothetical protein
MTRGTRIRQGILGGSLVILLGVYAAVVYCAPPGSLGGEAGADRASAASVPAGSPGQNDLVVHEWGTFLAMSGSDGTTLDGMYHEEHALPGFVHARSRDQLRLPSIDLKGETPVIYFYTKQRQKVRVGVGFPQGLWTQWYPQAAALNPALDLDARRLEHPRDGRICWRAELIPVQEIANDPAGMPRPSIELPAAGPDQLWNYARGVDSALVKTDDITRNPARPEFEKFLFYRGLGEARLPLRLAAGGGGTLTLEKDSNYLACVQHVFVLRVEKGRGAFRYLRALAAGESARGVIPSLEECAPVSSFTQAVSQALAEKLAESGLYPKEARALVNTWRNSYFETDGVRALCVLPQSWTDVFIPITIVPSPRQIVRVMVGRLELLTKEREILAENALRNLSSPDAARREQAFAFLHEQGRYVEPIVRRVLRTTSEQRVRALCRRLLLTGFVTELRAAIHRPADGARRQSEPLVLRAQLAGLLREIGLVAEARSEGEALLGLLRSYPLPAGQSPHSNPDLLALRAAAFEALGEDVKAATAYARSIELKARTYPWGDLLPPNAQLRDWWAGRAYAQALARSGKTQATIAGLQQKLASYGVSWLGCDRNDRDLHIVLVFLLDAEGRSAEADAHWAALAKNPQPVTLSSERGDAKPSGL